MHTHPRARIYEFDKFYHHSDDAAKFTAAGRANRFPANVTTIRTRTPRPRPKPLPTVTENRRNRSARAATTAYPISICRRPMSEPVLRTYVTKTRTRSRGDVIFPLENTTRIIYNDKLLFDKHGTLMSEWTLWTKLRRRIIVTMTCISWKASAECKKTKKNTWNGRNCVSRK